MQKQDQWLPVVSGKIKQPRSSSPATLAAFEGFMNTGKEAVQTVVAPQGPPAKSSLLPEPIAEVIPAHLFDQEKNNLLAKLNSKKFKLVYGDIPISNSTRLLACSKAAKSISPKFTLPLVVTHISIVKNQLAKIN